MVMADDLFEGNPRAPAMGPAAREQMRRQRGCGGGCLSPEDWLEMFEWHQRGRRPVQQGVPQDVPPEVVEDIVQQEPPRGGFMGEPMLSDPGGPPGALVPQTQPPPIAEDPGAFPDERPYGMAPYVWNKMVAEDKKKRLAALKIEMSEKRKRGRLEAEETRSRQPATSGPPSELPGGGPLANHSTPGFTARYNRYQKEMSKGEAYVRASVEVLNNRRDPWSEGNPMTLAEGRSALSGAIRSRGEAAGTATRTELADVVALQKRFTMLLEPASLAVEPRARLVANERLGPGARTLYPEALAAEVQIQQQLILNQMYDIWRASGGELDPENPDVWEGDTFTKLFQVMDDLEDRGAPISLIRKAVR